LKTALSQEERAMLTAHIPELDQKLGLLIEEARKLQEDARAANMRTTERNADSMSQTLQSARRKLSVFVEKAADLGLN
jgi:hypothetical protein